MKASFMIENPQEILATMKITMTVKEWEEMRDKLIERWPSSNLASEITSLLLYARRVLCSPEFEPKRT